MNWVKRIAAPGLEPAAARTLEMRIDARRWRQVRAICRRLAGRELSDAECFMMVTEHYLMKLGLHTRETQPQSSRKK